MTYFFISTAGGENFGEFEPFEMRFLKGKSLTKELFFHFFRAAGAPIWGFSGHNPKSGL